MRWHLSVAVHPVGLISFGLLFVLWVLLLRRFAQPGVSPKWWFWAGGILLGIVICASLTAWLVLPSVSG